MKTLMIKAPFWLGLIIPALLLRYDVPILISFPIAYLSGVIMSNLSWNIRAWIKREEARKGSYKF